MTLDYAHGEAVLTMGRELEEDEIHILPL